MAAKALSDGVEMANEERESDEEREKTKEYGSWWHVNKSGFPICEETWEKMWKYVEDVHPAGVDVSRKIRGQTFRKACYQVCVRAF